MHWDVLLSSHRRHWCMDPCGRSSHRSHRGDGGTSPVSLHFPETYSTPLQVWDGITDARIHFSASDLDLDVNTQGMSRITENINLQRGLLRYLSTMPDLHLIDKTKVTSIVREDEDSGSWPLVHLDNSRILRARLLASTSARSS